MTRDAKLFFLRDKDWKPIVDEIINSLNKDLKDDIAIFQLNTETSTVKYYAIITLSAVVDSIVLKHGATRGSNLDGIRNTLKDGRAAPLFGDRSILVHLLRPEID